MLKRKTVIQKSDQISAEKISLDNCFAKTCRIDSSKSVYGKTVDNHCKIVGNIAKYILTSYCLKQVAALFPKSSPLIVAVHDIGKISPTFQLKLAKSVSKLMWVTEHPEYSPYKDYNESLFGGHPTVSYAFLKSINKCVAKIAGQHHGAIHPLADIKEDMSEGFGGELWASLRNKEFLELSIYFDSDLRDNLTSTQISLLSGLTCVSDWIGSGYYFDNPCSDVETNIEKSVLDAGFKRFAIKHNLSFTDIFGFSPNTIQETFLKKITAPGVYIIEAPMGLGKTELALYAAYKLLSTDQASGIYFALPTQLTSQKIWERISEFLETVVDGDSRALLLHSNSHLVQSSLGEDALPGNSWFSSAKRGLLYPFAVGTVDQALLAVMNVRHSFVRSFGLAGKVVIIDEVHTYDCYTGAILDYLVEHLTNIGCTVIILSATLSAQRRSAILASQLPTEDYPVLSYKNIFVDEPCSFVNCDSIPDKRVEISFKTFDECRMKSLERAATGQQVLWIENTVKDAQNTFKEIAYLAKEQGIECGLIHSRFTSCDRDKKESYWVELLGKNSSIRSNRGRILVGTQVLEQSLDIDADFLISRFAPTDLILQRIGRLWRHKKTIRPSNSVCEAWFIDVNLQECIESQGKSFGLSSVVYSPYVLCRSLEVFKRIQEFGFIQIPSDIRKLINETYCSRTESDVNYQFMVQELKEGSKKRKGTNSLQQLARSNIANSAVILNDDEALTRYSCETDTQILIAKNVNYRKDLIEVEFYDGVKISVYRNVDRQSKETKSIAVQLMKHIVTVRKSLAPSPLTVGQAIKLGFDNYLYIGNKDDLSKGSKISFMLRDSSGKLRNYNEIVTDKNDYTYSYEKGLEVIKNNGN